MPPPGATTMSTTGNRALLALMSEPLRVPSVFLRRFGSAGGLLAAWVLQHAPDGGAGWINASIEALDASLGFDSTSWHWARARLKGVIEVDPEDENVIRILSDEFMAAIAEAA